jgi:transcription antitermination factor NusG
MAEPVFPWFALRVKSRFEKKTALHLEGLGLEPFNPLYRSRRRWSDRTKEVDLPLFPGYVFCRFDPNDRLPVLQTPGVVSIVGFGGRPAPVDEEEIAAIQAIVRSGAPALPWPFLREGQRVRLVRGALRGLQGILLDVKSDCRLVVSVTLLQRSVAVEIDRGDVEPVL